MVRQLFGIVAQYQKNNLRLENPLRASGIAHY